MELKHADLLLSLAPFPPYHLTISHERNWTGDFLNYDWTIARRGTQDQFVIETCKVNASCLATQTIHYPSDNSKNIKVNQSRIVYQLPLAYRLAAGVYRSVITAYSNGVSSESTTRHFYVSKYFQKNQTACFFQQHIYSKVKSMCMQSSLIVKILNIIKSNL